MFMESPPYPAAFDADIKKSCAFCSLKVLKKLIILPYV